MVNLKIGVLVFLLLVTSFDYLSAANSSESIKTKSDQIEIILGRSFESYQNGLNLDAYTTSLEAYNLLDSSISKELQGKVFIYVGNFALESEKFNVAIENYNNALDVYTLLNNRKKLATAYGNLAVVFEKIDKPDLSLRYNFQALDLYISSKDTGGISTAYTNIGNTYADVGELNLCRTYFLKALELDSISKDTGQISIDYTNLGNLHSILNDDEIAIKYYIASLDIDIKLNDAMGQCISNFNIGHSYFELDNLEKSLIHSLKSYQLAKQLHSVNYLKKNSNLLSEIYTLKKNDKKAYWYFQEYTAWCDSMDFKQKEAILYAKQLENKNNNESDKSIEVNSNTSLDDDLWSLMRIIIYIAILLAAAYLFYVMFNLFTKR